MKLQSIALLLMLVVALFNSDITAAATKNDVTSYAEMIQKIAKGITARKASFTSWLKHKKDSIPNINYFEAVVLHDGKEVTIQYFPKDEDADVLGCVSFCVKGDPGLSFTTDLNGMVLGTPKDKYFKFIEAMSSKFK